MSKRKSALATVIQMTDILEKESEDVYEEIDVNNRHRRQLAKLGIAHRTRRQLAKHGNANVGAHEVNQTDTPNILAPFAVAVTARTFAKQNPPSKRRDRTESTPEKDEDALFIDKTEDRAVKIRDYENYLFTGYWEKGTSQAGYGHFKYVENGKNGENVSTYVGEFSNGTMNGQGKLYLARNNSEYEGSFKSGAPCGQGVCNWAETGWHYSGEWFDYNRHGRGKWHRVDEAGEVAEYYEGDWIEGECFKNVFNWFRIAALTLPIF